jgi:hypothetical protein
VIGRPATLSKKRLTGILRDELHFKGLIVTDALAMGAIANNFEPSWTVETAILAGADVILMPVKLSAQNSLQKLEKIYQHRNSSRKIPVSIFFDKVAGLPITFPVSAEVNLLSSMLGTTTCAVITASTPLANTFANAFKSTARH